MAASKAWKILRRAEADLGFPLVESVSGGKTGGYSKLTKEGKEFLERYQMFRKEIDQAAEESFMKYFGNQDAT